MLYLMSKKLLSERPRLCGSRRAGHGTLVLTCMILCTLLFQLPCKQGRSEPQASYVVLINIHTREKLKIPHGKIPSPSVLNRFLRCPADKRYTLMDPRLVLKATEAARAFGTTHVKIISAFRTARLNEAMRAEGHQVALKSRHINGQALDLRFPGVKIQEVCAHFKRVKLGGVGCYKRANFVHIDVGPVRSWSG